MNGTATAARINKANVPIILSTMIAVAAAVRPLGELHGITDARDFRAGPTGSKGAKEIGNQEEAKEAPPREPETLCRHKLPPPLHEKDLSWPDQ